MLGLVQCGRDPEPGLCLTSLLTSVASHLQTCLTGDTVTPARVRALMASLASIRSCAARADSTDITREEFAYLRLCILFKTSKILSEFTNQYRTEENRTRKIRLTLDNFSLNSQLPFTLL